MPKVRIYRPAKTAMQSGEGNTRAWVMEFEAAAARSHDPLMGWVSSADTRAQVRLGFPTEAEALAYAELQGYEVSLAEPKTHKLRPKSYADNFKYNRVQ
jgi:hypothetical protein